ncbi:MAG: TetR/AcrR family transcriptional regulator [Planctomycetota bacterium]
MPPESASATEPASTTTAQDQRRIDLLPVLARVFADHGYAGTTTAKLAAATELRENQLYRLWPSKKAMFLAVLEDIAEQQTRWWEEHFEDPRYRADPAAAARAVLDDEGKQRGSTGLHRLIFAGLSEASDPDVRAALQAMYARLHAYIQRVVKQQKTTDPDACLASPALCAWSLVALGSFANIARELDLFPVATQRRLFNQLGGALAGLNPDA